MEAPPTVGLRHFPEIVAGPYLGRSVHNLRRLGSINGSTPSNKNVDGGGYESN